MTDEMGNPVLEPLRHMRRSISHIGAGISEIKLRLSAVESHVGRIQVAGPNGRMDRFDEPMTRFERRLELADA